MSINIRFPNITALTEREQITQIKSYLHQLVQQLNYALSTYRDNKATKETKEVSDIEVQGAEISYYELKSLIVQQLRAATQALENGLDKKVSNSVESALTQAKESGEFQGEPGKDGTDGKTPAISFALDEDGYLWYEVTKN